MSGENGIISFGKYWSFKMIIPFLVPVGCITRTIMFYYLSQTDSNNEQYSTIYGTMSSICQILGGSIELISIIRSNHMINNEKQPINNKSKEINSIHYVSSPKKLSICLFILLVGLMNWSIMLVYNMLQKQMEATTIQMGIRIFQIIFTGVFCLLILKTKFHRHQTTSMILVSVGVIIVGIMESLSKNDKDNKVSIEYYFYFLGLFLLSGLQEVIEKKIMDSKFISPYRLLFFEGIIGIVIGSIAITINVLTGYKFENNFSSFWNTIKRKEIYFVFFILGDTFLIVLEKLTNFYFSPTQRSVSDTLSSLFWWIFSFFIPNGSKISTLIIGFILGYIIIFFGSLLYNELIVFHFCGFSKNTKYEVMQRGDIEISKYDSISLLNFEEDISNNNPED